VPKTSEARREYQSRYYAENKVKLRKRRKTFYDKNRVRIVARQREIYRKNKARYRNYRLRDQYGITVAQFNARLAEQDHKCPICGDIDAKFVVDHDHETGSVRGIICGRCNSGLGMLQDSLENLKSAVRYLETAQKEGKDAHRNGNSRDQRSRVPRANR
jgi:recombination endonuclease VII